MLSVSYLAHRSCSSYIPISCINHASSFSYPIATSNLTAKRLVQEAVDWLHWLVIILSKMCSSCTASIFLLLTCLLIGTIVSFSYMLQYGVLPKVVTLITKRNLDFKMQLNKNYIATCEEGKDKSNKMSYFNRRYLMLLVVGQIVITLLKL